MTDYGDLGAAYAAFQTALGDGTASWGAKVFADFAPRKTTGEVSVGRPYVIFSFSGGGDESFVVQNDPEFVIDVICHADTADESLIGDEEIRLRLDDHGELDRYHTVGGAAIGGTSTYMLKTITREMRIHFVEQVQGATQIYHSGARYRVTMEKR